MMEFMAIIIFSLFVFLQIESYKHRRLEVKMVENRKRRAAALEQLRRETLSKMDKGV